MAKKRSNPEMAKNGLLEFISAKIGRFKASDYGGVQRAVKLTEIIDRALPEVNLKRVEVFTKYGIKPGESAAADHPKFAELTAELDVIANEDSPVSIKDLQIFTVAEFEKDAIIEGGLGYNDAGVLGKWLVKD